MKIILNGEERAVPDSINIKYLFGLLKFDPSKAVVELNRKILKSDEWGQAVLKDNDKIEVISFVGGG